MAQHDSIAIDYVKPIANINANWVSIVTYVYGAMDTPEIGYDLKMQRWGETESGIRHSIRLAKKNGMKVMLKPSVWFPDWGWPGDYLPDDAVEWAKWESNYLDYILWIAQICQEEGVEMLCVATEHKKIAITDPNCWRRIINQVKIVYNGPLTYAANWDSFDKITFWDALDYIGVDAYFPLSEEATPSVPSLQKAWQAPKQRIKAFAQQFDLPVLFTEFGYKSVDSAMGKQWLIQEIDDAVPANHQAQINGYDAIFKEFWDENWFNGGFIWQWKAYHEYEGGLNNNNYTPQNKPASDFVSDWYKAN